VLVNRINHAEWALRADVLEDVLVRIADLTSADPVPVPASR
jgi:hypothetical protein